MARLAKLGVDLDNHRETADRRHHLIHPFFGRTASLVEGERESAVSRVMQPERAEFGPLALREFADLERDSGGKDQCNVNSSSGLCY